RLFGGEEAMELVHAHFDADARAWMALDELSERREATLPSEALSVAMLNDLFSRTLEGRTEIWDTWCNVAEAQGLQVESQPLEIFGLKELRTLATPAEWSIVRRYLGANTALANGLRALWNSSKL